MKIIEKKMIQGIKDCGRDLIDRAEDLVGNGEGMIDSIDIMISIPVVDSRLPEISITRNYISSNTYYRLVKEDTNEKN